MPQQYEAQLGNLETCCLYSAVYFYHQVKSLGLLLLPFLPRYGVIYSVYHDPVSPGATRETSKRRVCQICGLWSMCGFHLLRGDKSVSEEVITPQQDEERNYNR